MLSGWARKPFSMLHCPFDEVMLLDADLVVVRDPAYLFDHPLCTEHGCLFWPDFKPLPPDHIVWKACCIPYDGGVSFQGGQQIIDKRRCREALELTVRFNYDWEVWYELIHGEQDTYRYCWGMTGTRYNVVPGKPGVLKHTILEYDPEGHRVFQHRCADKWSLEGNSSVPDFWFEPDCLKYVEEFRKVKESLAKRSSTNGATSSSVASSAALLCRA